LWVIIYYGNSVQVKEAYHEGAMTHGEKITNCLAGCFKNRGEEGRPETAYTEWITEVGLAKVKMWAEEGLIGKQIANNIGIHYSFIKIVGNHLLW